MTCDDVRECLIDRLDGTLAPERDALVTAHVEACAACREELEALRETEAAVRGLPRVAAPDALLARLRAALDAEERAAAVSAGGRAGGAVLEPSRAPAMAAPAAPAPNIIRPARFLGWARALSAVAAGVIAVVGVGVYWRGLQDLKKAEPTPVVRSVRDEARPEFRERKAFDDADGVLAPSRPDAAGGPRRGFAAFDEGKSTAGAGGGAPAALAALAPPDTRSLAVSLGETYDEARAAIEALLLARGLDYVAVADAGGGLLFVTRTTPGEYGALLNRIEVLPEAEFEETRYGALDAAQASAVARELSTKAESVAPAERVEVVLALGAAEYERRLAEIEEGARRSADLADAFAFYETQIEAARARGVPVSALLQKARESKDVDEILAQADKPAAGPAPAEEKVGKIERDGRPRSSGTELAGKEKAPEAEKAEAKKRGEANEGERAGADRPDVAAGERQVERERDARSEAEARALAQVALSTASSAANAARDAGKTAPTRLDEELALVFEADAHAAVADSKQALESGDLAAARAAYARSKRAFDDAYGLADRLRREEAGRRLARAKAEVEEGARSDTAKAGAEDRSAPRARLGGAADEQTLDGAHAQVAPPAPTAKPAEPTKPDAPAAGEPPVVAETPPPATPSDSEARGASRRRPGPAGGDTPPAGAPSEPPAEPRVAAPPAPTPAPVTPPATPPAGWADAGEKGGSDLPLVAGRDQRPAPGGSAGAAQSGPAPTAPSATTAPPPAPPPAAPKRAPAGSGGGGGALAEGEADAGTGLRVSERPAAPATVVPAPEPAPRPSAPARTPTPAPSTGVPSPDPAPAAIAGTVVPPADHDGEGHEHARSDALTPSTGSSTGEAVPGDSTAGKRDFKADDLTDDGRESGLGGRDGAPPKAVEDTGSLTFGLPSQSVQVLDPEVIRILDDLRRDGRFHVVRVAPEPGQESGNGVLVLIRVAPASAASSTATKPAAAAALEMERALRERAAEEAPAPGAAPGRR